MEVQILDNAITDMKKLFSNGIRWKFLRGLSEIKYWIRAAYRRVAYQWLTSRKMIKLDKIAARDWRDIDTLLFESVSQLIINFVENEKSSRWHVKRFLDWSIPFDELDKWDKHPNVIAYANASWIDKWKHPDKWNWMLAQASLEWEMSLVNEEIEGWEPEEVGKKSRWAIQAEEVVELYKYFKFEVPNRKDPWEAFEEPEHHYVDENGNFTNKMLAPSDDFGMSRAVRSSTPESREYYNKITDLEQRYYEKDTEMCMRVLKIRQGLWT